MSKSLQALVDETVQLAIRSFDPCDPTIALRLDSELERVENVTLAAGPVEETRDLLGNLRETRIWLAYERGDFQAVIRWSQDFISSYPIARPDSHNVMLFRLNARHALGDHDREIAEALAYAKLVQTEAEAFVMLLGDVATRHPGSLTVDDQLSAKVTSAVESLNSRGFSLPSAWALPEAEHVIVTAATEVRRAYRLRTQAILS